MLDHDEAPVRIAAGEALLDVAYEYYAEVARGVERALGRGHRGLSMCELPHVIAEVGEPSALGLLRRFLETGDPEIIAATIEALVTLDDPAAVAAIEPFLDDERTVSFDEADDETGATLAELAQEAIEALGGPDEGDDESDA
jgi:HEAT repeat protein